MEVFHYFVVTVPPLQELSQNATLDATLSTLQDLFQNLTPDSLGCNRYHNVLTYIQYPYGNNKGQELHTVLLNSRNSTV